MADMARTYTQGDMVPSTFDPGLVAASYFASLCGCLLTVEILHRRGTALRNLRSWLETLACAISMGLVGVWCMHFIGNRAIILGDNNPEIQLVYSSNYTALSVVLPVIGLTIAFSTAEFPVHRTWIRWLTLSCTGIIAGLSIVGMHYVANFGVSNYDLTYLPRYLAASIIIAIGDCLGVLVLFYTLREQWISYWWKRLSCAMALAGGVSAMHFTAATNCGYKLRKFNSEAQIQSRNEQVIVAGVMCGASATIAMAYLVIARWRKRRQKTRSTKVMLACALFDPSGRILVTTDGILPCREITDKFNHRTFADDFDSGHPVFQRIFRITHNWASVGDLISTMKSHLRARADNGMAQSRPSSSQSSVVYNSDTYGNYELLFEERFCTAAASIALSLHLPLENIGVLYDRIIETGTLDTGGSKRSASIGAQSPARLEAALRLCLFGKGQLMFLTREVQGEEIAMLLNAGYRFASVHQVGRTIAFALQIPLPVAESHVSGLKRYVEYKQITDKSGTWLSFFAMIPKPHGKGFDIVVKRENREQLPDVQISRSQPLPWQQNLFEKLDGLSAYDVLFLLQDRTGKLSDLLRQDLEFIARLTQGIVTLIQPFPHEWVRDATFWSKQLLAHYTHPFRKRSTVTTLYAFTVIGDMHASIENSEAIVRTPRTFFDARHRCYEGSPDHVILARDIHQAFGPLFASKRKTSWSHAGKLSITLTSSPLNILRRSHSAPKSSSYGG